jgi:CheY-like chemotaxis protein
MSISLLIEEALEELRLNEQPRVLLAEDDEDHAELLFDCLVQQGFDVTVVCDGDELCDHISVAQRSGAPP